MIPFNPSAYQECDQPQKKFDSFQARKLAGLIQQAYVQFDWFVKDEEKNISPEQRNRLNLGQDFQLNRELYENKTPFGFVASETNSKDVFIVFRGTRKFIEWFKDVNIPLVNYGNGKTEKGYGLKVIASLLQKFDHPTPIENSDEFGLVALGFREIYTSLRNEMIDALKKCYESSPDSRIFVTGHSLGGALATLAIPDIIKNTEFQAQNIKLYTFASPRCGDKTFADAFNNTDVEHWRIANTEDMVTMIPFPTGNVFSPGDSPAASPEKDRLTKTDSVGKRIEEDLGTGGVAGVDKNPNPLFGFFKAMYERSGDLLLKSLKNGKEVYNSQKRRMPDYCHTGTPVYFTFHDAALERHHNLEVYMKEIDVEPLPPISPRPEPAMQV